MRDDQLVPLDLIQQLLSPPFEYTEHDARILWNYFPSNTQFPSSRTAHLYQPHYRLTVPHSHRILSGSHVVLPAWRSFPFYYPSNLKLILWTNLHNSVQLVEVVQCLPSPNNYQLSVQALWPPQGAGCLPQTKCSIIICYLKRRRAF